ncbi:MAG: NADH-quinone oxidoreductase, subunit [Gammaproteobacteria bacterium]|jgi:NADH-quinone oxidoreductase subunit E|nr:NADH-quinone oxidoreductase, subunit [Gammaproteobacteria bacterium]
MANGNQTLDADPIVSLSAEAKQQIEAWLAKYPPEQRQSAVIPALHIVQEENGGWLSKAHLNSVADFLRIPRIAVYEVATFYSMFELKPVGTHKIAVCNSISCYLCDAKKIMSHLEKRLGIKMGETTADGRFTLKEVECLAACRNAPAMQIGKVYYENLTTDKIDVILDELP